MDLLATWSTAVQSAWRQALTLRRPDTTIPIHEMSDDEVPSEQLWQRQLRRDNDGSGEYDEQSGYDPSEYDDNDVTIGGEAHPATSTSTMVATTISQRSSKDLLHLQP